MTTTATWILNVSLSAAVLVGILGLLLGSIRNPNRFAARRSSRPA